MAAHARLKNEFMEDKKYHNLMRWLIKGLVYFSEIEESIECKGVNSPSSQLWLSWLMTKPTNWPVGPAKTQISLGICPVWSESSLCAQWVAKCPSFHHADSEDSDQTGWMPRLIWVFAGHTCHSVGFVMKLMCKELLRGVIPLVEVFQVLAVYDHRHSQGLHLE